jgi:hypothetical protein
MTGLESQEEATPKRILFFMSMSWMGQIRTHRRDEVWSGSLCKTFFVMTLDDQIPVIEEKPLVACGCRKFQLDALGDHLCTCTDHSGVNKDHTGWTGGWTKELAQTTHKEKTQQVSKSRVRHCGDIELVVYL